MSLSVPFVERATAARNGVQLNLTGAILSGWTVISFCKSPSWKYNSPTLIDNRPRAAAALSEAKYGDNLAACEPDLNALYLRCAEACPDFTVSAEEFRSAILRAIDKYLIGSAGQNRVPSSSEIRQFIGELQASDIYLSLACAGGDEHAWWQFDRLHRAFIERLANRLVRTGLDANEVIDSVYVELFGTKTVGDVRQSKFRSYTGRGTLRGWLRTIILHSAVDLHRSHQTEVPLEVGATTDDEARERQPLPVEVNRTEDLMLANVVRERYRAATVAALDQSLAALDDHETLLLLYYHVEGLKLREIARIVEQPKSPIRRWFQRQSRRQTQGKPARVYESTVMRWLEKVYRKISDGFRRELTNRHGLTEQEIDICLSIATEDLAQAVKLNRVEIADEVNQNEPG